MALANRATPTHSRAFFSENENDPEYENFNILKLGFKIHSEKLNEIARIPTKCNYVKTKNKDILISSKKVKN